MSDPFIGEIRYLGFNFAPRGWATCNGATLAISQQTALFALIGTTFGGNGTSTFMLPNLAGRQICSAGQSPGQSNRVLGETFGFSTVILTQSELAAHNHTIAAYEGATGQTAAPAPSGASGLGVSDNSPLYAAPSGATLTFAPNAISSTGNGLPHDNTQPALVLWAAIALEGAFPSFP